MYIFLSLSFHCKFLLLLILFIHCNVVKFFAWQCWIQSERERQENTRRQRKQIVSWFDQNSRPMLAGICVFFICNIYQIESEGQRGKKSRIRVLMRQFTLFSGFVCRSLFGLVCVFFLFGNLCAWYICIYTKWLHLFGMLFVRSTFDNINASHT